MELTDYQKRDAHIVKYLKYMIAKCETAVKKYPNTSLVEDVRRKAYKDILFKMTKNGQRLITPETKGEEI